MKFAVLEIDYDIAPEVPALLERVGIKIVERLSVDAMTGVRRWLVSHPDLPEACAVPRARPWLTVDERDGMKTPRLLSWELVDPPTARPERA